MGDPAGKPAHGLHLLGLKVLDLLLPEEKVPLLDGGGLIEYPVHLAWMAAGNPGTYVEPSVRAVFAGEMYFAEHAAGAALHHLPEGCPEFRGHIRTNHEMGEQRWFLFGAVSQHTEEIVIRNETVRGNVRPPEDGIGSFKGKLELIHPFLQRLFGLHQPCYVDGYHKDALFPPVEQLSCVNEESKGSPPRDGESHG